MQSWLPILPSVQITQGHSLVRQQDWNETPARPCSTLSFSAKPQIPIASLPLPSLSPLQTFVTYSPPPHNTRSIHLLDLHCLSLSDLCPLLNSPPLPGSPSFFCIAIVSWPPIVPAGSRVRVETSAISTFHAPLTHAFIQPSIPDSFSSTLRNFTRFGFAVQQQANANHLVPS